MMRFSDFAEDAALEGSKMRINDILEKEILITAYQVGESRFGHDGNCNYLKLQFELDGDKHILFTGSGVLLRQCEKYADRMPFLAKITKPGKYYTFQ